jgi:two-component system sensor histidine kinase CiaH
MFTSARFRLTFWFVVIVALISICFTSLIYRDVSLELERSLVKLVPLFSRSAILNELAAAKHILLMRMVFVNLVIVTSTAIAGFFLAGKALQPIKEALEEQKRFTSDASHELRTPLTVLRSEIEVALRDKEITKQARQLLKSNLEEVNRMQNLTNYLLSLSRYEKNSNKLPKIKLQLDGIVKSIVTKYQIVANKKSVDLVLDVQPATITAHQTSIEELLSILIDNAIKYSPKDGKVNIKVKSSRTHAILKVEDGGVGIYPDDLPYIFNRFYRADTSRTKHITDGFGLGLAIAKSIVDIHKGEIKVRSKVNQGTTFSVILPR